MAESASRRLFFRLLIPGLFVVAVLVDQLRRRTPPGQEPDGGVQEKADFTELSGDAFGSTFTVRVLGDLDSGQLERVQAAIAQEIALVDRLFSTWRPDSELSQFNAAISPGPHPFSPEAIELLSLSQAVSLASNGAYDPTVGPLVRAWGFGAEPGAQPPTPEQLSLLRTHVGYGLLRLDPVAHTLEKSHPETWLDLSAIAPGWAADRISSALLALSLPNHMVEVGGEVMVRGHNPEGEQWRLAIERPDSETRAPWARVGLTDEALATSGDYRAFREVNGERVSHTIDPRTGSPIRHNLASVSVIHESAALADAWATAFSVLGPEEGFALASHLGLPALFLVRTADGFEEHQTPAFDHRRLPFQPPRR